MRMLLALVLSAAGLVAASGAANAQYYYGYRYGAQMYYPPGYGYGFNPGYYNGYMPGVNQTVISVSPYWRPLVINTPVVTTPYGPNYYYSNYYGFRTTPFGYNWAASRYQWVDGGLYNPLVYPAYYPAYNPGYVVPAGAVAPAAVVVTPRGRITRGFTPVANPLTGGVMLPDSFDNAGTGSFTPWGAYMPGTGTYLNPFSGMVR